MTGVLVRRGSNTGMVLWRGKIQSSSGKERLLGETSPADILIVGCPAIGMWWFSHTTGLSCLGEEDHRGKWLCHHILSRVRVNVPYECDLPGWCWPWSSACSSVCDVSPLKSYSSLFSFSFPYCTHWKEISLHSAHWLGESGSPSFRGPI